MTTPAMAAGGAARNIALTLWWMWLATFVVSRLYLVHEAYIEEAGKRSDERWLLDKCHDPEFYSNIRQHTDLCTEVANNARSSLLLKALHKVASATHLCGQSSCTDAVYTFVIRFGWQASLVVALLMVVAPNFVFSLIRHIQHQRMMSHKEQAFMQESSCVISPSSVARSHHLRMRSHGAPKPNVGSSIVLL